MSRHWIAAAALVAALGLGRAPVARAQDAPTDEALERLLKKLGDGPAPAPDAKPEAAKPADEAKPKAEAEKPSEAKKADEPKGKAEPAKDKPKGEVAGKDKELDELLEKLGQTSEEPKAQGKAAKPEGEEGQDKDKAPGGKADADAPKLQGEKKELDEHLRELIGRRSKKKDGQDGDDEAGGKLGEAVKKMREVEQRLGQPDTGEETRKKQAEIIKDFDQLIAETRKMGQGQGKGKGRKVADLIGQAGLKPGQKPGQEGQNPNAQGVGASRPKSPVKDPLAVGAKDEWGHLPPELRDEMDNVFREESLPSRKARIERYYLSISKGRQPAGE